MAVLSLDDAKKYLNITSATNDDEIDETIDAAVSAIEQIVGPIEVTGDLTAKVRPNGYGGLILPVVPVAQLVSVTPYAGVALSAGDLDLDQEAGLVDYGVGASGGRFGAQQYTVVYRAGRNPVPPDLLLAVKEMVRHLWTTQRGSGTGRRPGGPQSEALANTLPGAAYSLPIRVMQLLGPYTMVGFA